MPTNATQNGHGYFTVQGKSKGSRGFYTVSVQGDHVLIEFCNNAVFPIHAERGWDSWYALYCNGAKILQTSVEKSTEISVVITYICPDYVLFSLSCFGFSCQVTLYMSGELRMLNWHGPSFSDSEMQDYFRRNCLRHVIGCSVFNGITSYVKPDCYVESHGSMYVIFFPNGMKFPVICDSGVVICDVEVTKSNEQSFLCRVIEMGVTSVEFKIGVFEYSRVRWLRDSIKYNEAEAVFRGSHVRTSHLLRKMLLKW